MKLLGFCVRAETYDWRRGGGGANGSVHRSLKERVRHKNLFCVSKFTSDVIILFRVEMEGLVRLDSRDMREIIDKEVAKQEARYEQLIKQWDEK